MAGGQTQAEGGGGWKQRTGRGYLRSPAQVGQVPGLLTSRKFGFLCEIFSFLNIGD